MHWSDSFRPVLTGSTWYWSELIALGTGRTDWFHWFQSESGWKNWRIFLLFGLYCDPKFPIGIQPVPTGSDQNLRGTAKTSQVGRLQDRGKYLGILGESQPRPREGNRVPQQGPRSPTPHPRSSLWLNPFPPDLTLLRIKSMLIRGTPPASTSAHLPLPLLLPVRPLMLHLPLPTRHCFRPASC